MSKDLWKTPVDNSRVVAVLNYADDPDRVFRRVDSNLSASVTILCIKGCIDEK